MNRKMRLKRFKIRNFRGYKSEITIDFDNLTCLIGKNDIGKSTVLEALDIFFNDGKGTIKIDKDDLCKQRDNGDDDIELTACFTELPDKIIIDATNETSLASEYLLNNHNELEVLKRFHNAGTPKVFVKAIHPQNPACSELLYKKKSELQRIVQELGLECNQAVNASMRQAIWHYYSNELEMADVNIDATKEEAKAIWSKLAVILPVYTLFQSDRRNTDTDDEIQDPLKAAVKEILSEEHIKQQLYEIAQTIQQRLNDVSQRTLEKLREMDASIAESLTPSIPDSEALKWQDVFKSVSIAGDENIPVNKRGSGVRRLILLNFFRAEAERRAIANNGNGIIYAIEEPETSQHTENQRKLIEAFKRLSQTDGVQVILTTHSAQMVKLLTHQDLRMVKNTEDRDKSIVRIEPNLLSYPSLNEVNYLAFGEISTEYHDELYGLVERNQWKGELAQGRTLREYKRLQDDGNYRIKSVSLTQYIRDVIHHPENTANPMYTHQELAQSISDMRNLILRKINEGAYWVDDEFDDER